MNFDWNTLINQGVSERLVQRLKELIESFAVKQMVPEDIASDTGESICSVKKALKLLVNGKLLDKRVVYYCPNCEELLSEEESKMQICSHCEKAFAELGGIVSKKEIFLTHTSPSRDVKWLITIHGMNTLGSWQEALSWLLATQYKYSIPVDSYKYGLILNGALMPWKLNKLVANLADRIRRMSQCANVHNYGDKPDIIAHSLGTWLIGHALQKNKDLKIRRLILTGSILTPDFDWQKLINSGQIKNVMNYYGTNDIWPKISHYIIPHSGPSGSYGFCTKGIFNVPAEGYSHGDFFKNKNLSKQLKHTWKLFLNLPDSDLEDRITNKSMRKKWRPAPQFLHKALLNSIQLISILCIPILIVVLGVKEVKRNF